MKLSSILTGIGIGGVVVTGVLSYKAGKKAREDGFEFEPNDIKDKDKIKKLVKYTWKPLLAGTATVICISGAQKVNMGSIAVATAASASAAQLLDRYKDKIKKYIPEDKLKDFMKDISEPTDREPPKKKIVLKRHDYGPNDLPWMSSEMVKSNTVMKDFAEIEEQIIISIPYCDLDIITTPSAFVEGVMNVNKYFAFASYATVGQFMESMGVKYDKKAHPEWNVVGWEWDDPDYWLEFPITEVWDADGMKVYILEFPFTPKIIDCLTK